MQSWPASLLANYIFAKPTLQADVLLRLCEQTKCRGAL